MPLTLTVLHGQARGDLVITQGRSPAMVGRSPVCSVALDDSYVDDTHAAFYFDGATAHVRDLGSRTGTWLNGAGVQRGDAPLSTGDRVQIGQTMFSVAVTSDVAAEAPRNEALDTLVASFQTTPRDCARFAMRAEASPLFALVDLADDRELLELLNESGEQFCALDETAEPDSLGETAPCLVSLSKGSSFLATLLESVWGNDRAVFFTSNAPFEQLYAHWLGEVEYDDDGEVMGVRFWLPGVLNEYLAGMSADDARSFFGPVRAFTVEGDEEGALVRWTSGREGLASERVELTLSTQG